MGRPRRHDRDAVLDHAKTIWSGEGLDALTVRALSARSGVSNGALYNAFGSRANLLARVWAREAEAFLRFQATQVAEQLAAPDPADAVVAAALAPAHYRAYDGAAADLLLSVTPESLDTPDLGEDERTALRRLRGTLSELIGDLSRHLWDRSDRAATLLVRYCVVDLPGALLLGGGSAGSPVALLACERAVRGILAAPPPKA